MRVCSGVAGDVEAVDVEELGVDDEETVGGVGAGGEGEQPVDVGLGVDGLKGGVRVGERKV